MLCLHVLPPIHFGVSEEVCDVKWDRAFVFELIMYHSLLLKLHKILLNGLLHLTLDLECGKFEEEHLPFFLSRGMSRLLYIYHLIIKYKFIHSYLIQGLNFD